MPVLVSRRNAMPILVSPSLFLLLVSPDTAARFDGARPRRTTIATSERKRSALHHGGVYPRRMMIGWSRAESEHRSTWASHAVAAAARKIVTNTAPPLGSGSYAWLRSKRACPVGRQSQTASISCRSRSVQRESNLSAFTCLADSCADSFTLP